MANLNAGQVKAEPLANPGIKEEPDTKDTNMSDEDIYEDTGDLDFTNAFQNVWLTRIPRTLWEQWSKLDDDEEIQIGTVRVEGDPTDIKRVFSPVASSYAIVYIDSEADMLHLDKLATT